MSPRAEALFPDLGVGVGLRAPFIKNFRQRVPQRVQWVEVISENYVPWPSGQNLYPRDSLLAVRAQVPVVLHGVSLSLGSSDPLNFNYLRRLKDLVQIVEPAWVSDHLCWSSLGGQQFYDLYPLPYTEEVIDHLVERIARVQDFLGRRILVENLSSYVEFSASQMPEWEFVREVISRADCGLLLDINNIYVSSVNHHFDPLAYLQALPPERVGQIHVAGHTRQDNFLIDTHDAPVCAEVWSLLVAAQARFTGKATMLERDGKLPEWREIESELGKIHHIKTTPKRVSPARNGRRDSLRVIPEAPL